MVERWEGSLKEFDILRGVNPFDDEVVNSEVSRREWMANKTSSVGVRESFLDVGSM
jgi:hypothetical protein